MNSFLVIIPARNEAPSLNRVIGEIKESFPEVEILVVDDASTDSTAEKLKSSSVRWLRLSVHLGIGGAMRSSLRYAVKLGHEYVVRVDGDGQHLASQISLLLEPLRQGQCDAVTGSRYLEIGGYRARGLRRLGQRLLAIVLSRFVGRNVTDPTSGAWAFGPRAVRVLSEHHPTGYPEPELILFLFRNGLKVAEVPVEMRPRIDGRSSLTLFREFSALARVLLAMVVVPLRKIVEEPRT